MEHNYCFLVECFSQQVTCCSSTSCMCVTCLFSLCWWLSVSVLHRFWNTWMYLGWISLISTRLSAREAGTMHSRTGALCYKLCVLNCFLVWDLLLVHIFTDDTMSLSHSWISCVLYCNITWQLLRSGLGEIFPSLGKETVKHILDLVTLRYVVEASC